jgi:hypothetical protein
MGGVGSGRPKNPPTPKKMLKEVLPVGDIFEDDELDMYNNLVDVYLNDFDVEDLTSSDMDDILDLAKNKVLEFRLLKSSKGNPAAQLDVAATIERLSKKNDKIKESLFSRRKDRVNPNEFKGFSIVDLVAAFNEEKKRRMSEKLSKLKEEQEVMLEKRKSYKGNMEDIDVVEGSLRDDDE